MNEKSLSAIKVLAIGFLGIIIVIGGIFSISYAYRKYSIWSRGMAGQAELAEAEWTKKVSIETARAKKDAAVFEAEAEVARAKGVAEANRIIGESLNGNESYLRYLYINNIQQGENREVIYIPTEAGLPILEAGRR